MDTKSKTTREKLLLAALDLFSEKGFEATTVDEIASSMGMKGPNIYNYFKGKKGLFMEIASIFEDVYKEKIKFKENAPEIIHNADDLKRFSMAQIRNTINDDNIRKLRRMTTMEQYKNKYLCDKATEHQYSNIITSFTNIMASLMKQGAIKECDPETLALVYAAPVSILIQLYDREPERKREILKKAEAHIDLFIDTYFIKKSDNEKIN